MSATPELFEENGREYHNKLRGLYWLPHDEPELERLDILHGLFYDEDKLNLPLHRSSIKPASGDSLRILDLGTGTGFWAMEMADRYTDAEVIGTDLANIQPEFVPRNVSFKPALNFNDRYWPFAESSFDLIHMSMITACVVNWRELYDNAHRHLRPGGFVEHLEFDIAPFCTDGTLRPESAISQWYRDLTEASAAAGRTIAYDPAKTESALRSSGFVDITYERVEIPWHYYRRPGENYQIGGTFQVTMAQGDGFEAYCYAPFSRVKQWTKSQIDDYCAAVKQEVASTRLHIHSYIHLWTARKP